MLHLLSISGRIFLTEYSKTVKLKIAKWYAKNMLQIEHGYNAHFDWKNKDDPNECTMTLTCFDDYPYPPFRRNKEELESYLIRKFGSMIIEDKRRSPWLDLTSASKGLPLTHPIVLKDKKDYPSQQDNFDEEYLLPLTRKQLIEANSTLADLSDSDNRLKANHIKKRSGYESDIYNLRMGTWH